MEGDQHGDHMSAPLLDSAGSSNEEQPLEMRCYEQALRKKLKFFFMNPIEKWNAKKKFPFKLIVQIVKIVLVTLQLCLFAHSRYIYVHYSWNNRITFSHLFLKGWETTREIDLYPPSVGPLAVYSKKDFFDTISFAINGYKNVGSAIGPYSYAEENNNYIPPTLCLTYYKEGLIFGFNESYSFNNDILSSCCTVENGTLQSLNDCSNGTDVEFSSLISASLQFSLKTVNFKTASSLSAPDCYQFDIQVIFDNEDTDGQMRLSLEVDSIRLSCKGDITYSSNNADSNIDYIMRTVLNIFVILICSLSFVLCMRAVIRAQQLKRETILFFKNCYGRNLSLEGRWEFWNLWYMMIIINDLLIIIGSAMKEEIERKLIVGDQWNTCSLFLGTGNLLVWFGVLRYLGFFKTYNVIVLTMKKAFPKVVRFLFCALLIYAGFTFCGWLILGPYHIKFRTLASTSECLFALINGDDMFATFSIMRSKNGLIWWYSRIYLYLFISLYIYVVLSLFISIIMDAYETIKIYYKDGFPKNDLQVFMSEKCDDVFVGDHSYSSGSTSVADAFCGCLNIKESVVALVRGRSPSGEDCGTI